MNANKNNHASTPKADKMLETQIGVNARLDRKLRKLNRDLLSVHKTSRLLNAPLDLPQVLEIVVKTVAKIPLVTGDAKVIA